MADATDKQVDPTAAAADPGGNISPPPTGTSGNGAAAPGTEPAKVDLKDTPEFQKEVQGLLNNRNEILAEKREMESKLKGMAEELKVLQDLGGQDGIKALVELQRRMAEDETMKYFAEGKESEYRERVTSALRSDMQRKIDALEQQVAEKDGIIAKTNESMQNQMLDNKIESLALRTPGLRPAALPVIKLLAKQKFEYDAEQGREVSRDNTGQIEIGPSGQFLDLAEYFAKILPEEAPYLFQGTSGIGNPASQSAATPGQVRISLAELSDPKVYQKLREEHGPDGVAAIIRQSKLLGGGGQ